MLEAEVFATHERRGRGVVSCSVAMAEFFQDLDKRGFKVQVHRAEFIDRNTIGVIYSTESKEIKEGDANGKRR